jgi:hypothetical protein
MISKMHIVPYGPPSADSGNLNPDNRGKMQLPPVYFGKLKLTITSTSNPLAVSTNLLYNL